MSGAQAGAQNACFTCHGLDGGGDGAGVPRVAGLNSGYLAHQLEAFADGRRHNESMRWIARQLTPMERLRVAEYYARLQVSGGASQSAAVPAIYSAGDPARNVPACASCHGSDANGIGSGIPPLAGQPAGYVAQQLEDWSRGRRRSDPDGVMLEIARALSPKEIAAVAAYVSALPVAAPRRGSAAASPGERHPGPRNGASALPQRVAGS
jgi:cytochrome c553